MRDTWTCRLCLPRAEHRPAQQDPRRISNAWGGRTEIHVDQLRAAVETQTARVQNQVLLDRDLQIVFRGGRPSGWMAMGSLDDRGLARSKRALATVRTTGLGPAITGRSRREGPQRTMTGRDHDPRGRAEHALVAGVQFLAADAAEPTPPRRRGPPPLRIPAAQTSW